MRVGNNRDIQYVHKLFTKLKIDTKIAINKVLTTFYSPIPGIFCSVKYFNALQFKFN